MTFRLNVRKPLAAMTAAAAGLAVVVAAPMTASAAPAATPAPVVSQAQAVYAANIALLRFWPAMEAAGSVLGTPYRWGGTTPAGFDCSGLVQWSMRFSGIELPRTSRAQQAASLPISAEQARPGDLVFFGSPVHHVGIYLGEGLMIHSPSSGKSVSIVAVERFGTTPSGYGRIK